jgi:hypothetical protein
MNTATVTQIDGRPIPMGDVSVRINQGHIQRIVERRLSRSRTSLFVGGAVAIAAAFLLSGGIGGRGPSPDPPGEPPVNQYRGH